MSPAGPARPRWRTLVVHGALLLATVATTLIAGTGYAPARATPAEALAAAAPYAASLLSILLVHEMGHYLAARRYGVEVSLPYFIPFPFSMVGTLGAFIRIRSLLPTRRAVLDVGAAGPLAGFAVALPLLFWGYAHSEVTPIPAHPNAAFQSPFSLACALLDGAPLRLHEAGMIVMGDSAITWLAARLTHGTLPIGADLRVGPIGFAAWIGMYVTTLNLLPIGQLDGGHVLYALFGRSSERVARVLSWALFGMGIFASWSWLVWWALIRAVVGVRHPPAAQEDELGRGRRIVAWACLAVLALTFVPVPFYV